MIAKPLKNEEKALSKNTVALFSVVLNDQLITVQTKKTHINQTQNINNMNILPFPNKMPMEEFKGKIGYVWGLKQPQKSYTLQTLEIMGVTLNNNYEKMNFIVCGTEKPARKYNEIYKNQACLSRIEVFRIEWIRDCIKFGKYLTDKQYDYHLTS
eukprot:TRINITY_DN3040_c0_g1_i3.p3 TRINITY_DN3040_c0_g1~~TRINITY_DN3040_c0_g1_i3.p3  ORF type:complete len:155 (+),score=11.39 TRINITY_DN3040_c0_g1_i3:158-622(+)